MFIISLFLCDTLNFQQQYGVTSVFIFSAGQSESYLPIFDLLKPFTRGEPLLDCTIYSTVLYMIGRSKMNERLPDFTAYEMSLYLNKSKKTNKKKDTTNIYY